MKTKNTMCHSREDGNPAETSVWTEINSFRSGFPRSREPALDLIGGWQTHHHRPSLWFTLVELIVVITILVILGTIAFTSLSWFQSSARDSDRVTTLKNIDSGLSLFQLKTGSYPLPEASGLGLVLTGSINGTIYVYLGVIGDLNTRNIKMNKIPTDPLSNTSYVYGVSNDQKYYQTATVLENTEAYNTSLIISTVYADASYQAKVNGNYPGYFKFSSGSEVWIANIPSLLWNNTGSVNLLSSGTYFVVNKQANLPYKLDTSTVIQNKDADQMVQAITGTGVATLTGVNITGITAETLTGTFTPEVLANFGWDIAKMETIVLGSASISTGTAVPNDCTLSGTVVAHGASVTAYSENTIVWNAVYDCTARQQTRTCSDGTLSGSGTYQYNSCVKGTPNSCSASGSYVYNTHTYSIPTLSHGSGAVNILSTNVSENNGTFQYTLSSITCNDGVYASVSENVTPTVQSCNGTYHIESNACVSDTKSVACGGSNPGATISTLGTSTANVTWNGSTWNATPNWSHISTAPGVCQYQCKAGYWYNGSTCITASAGSYVASAGATSQSQCTAGYYCAAGSISATQNDCPANSWCALGSGSPTACTGGATSPVRSVSVGACIVRWEQVYTSAITTTYIWTAPPGVTSVSVVVVSPASGIIGGALSYKNNIPVTPGVNYSVVFEIGAGNWNYFSGSNIVAAKPGNNGRIGDGGGNGGTSDGLAGGGAGGYSGNGWTGLSAWGNAGSGGGGGGAANRSGGGGVGIFGQGSNGAGGILGDSASGKGGSSGTDGMDRYNPGGDGGLYWGGAGSSTSNGTPGAGAIRIIWPGTSRTFPSTDVGS